MKKTGNADFAARQHRNRAPVPQYRMPRARKIAHQSKLA